MARRVLLLLVPLVLTAGCTTAVPGRPVAGPLPEVPTVACDYDKPAEGPAKDVDPPSGRAETEGTVVIAVETSQGALEFSFDAASAPCSVHNFRHLVAEKFFEGTSCHRLTTAGLWVLQCGDGTDTGRGTPGYEFDDPDAKTGGYDRGVIAMANRQEAGTNGSQFFIVHKDSSFDPDFPVLGRVSKGMDVIDKVAAGGVVPGTGFSETDGRPVLPLKFVSLKEK
ncbi:MAG: peptidylprolyl isomerase [Saccharothrix sp.]|nr:peptidylprolyl isomerase [Saccharothrix sp.]